MNNPDFSRNVHRNPSVYESKGNPCPDTHVNDPGSLRIQIEIVCDGLSKGFTNLVKYEEGPCVPSRLMRSRRVVN